MLLVHYLVLFFRVYSFYRVHTSNKDSIFYYDESKYSIPIEEAIKSIINQTIGFQNIQLILVNDGSPQNESKICNKY